MSASAWPYAGPERRALERSLWDRLFPWSTRHRKRMLELHARAIELLREKPWALPSPLPERRARERSAENSLRWSPEHREWMARQREKNLRLSKMADAMSPRRITGPKKLRFDDSGHYGVIRVRTADHAICHCGHCDGHGKSRRGMTLGPVREFEKGALRTAGIWEFETWLDECAQIKPEAWETLKAKRIDIGSGDSHT